MTGYVVYRRVSTAGQGESGLGLEAQDRDLAIFLEGEEGPEVLATFTDIMSGAKADRPELARALDMARQTRATLLVSKLDRLSRSVAFLAGLLEDKRVALKVAAMPHADKFQLHIYAALAEQERDFISRRTKAALAQAKARGRKLGGLRPGTARRNAAVAARADADAMRVKSIIVPMRESGATFRSIASALTNAGIAAPRGGAWTGTTVRNALVRIQANQVAQGRRSSATLC